MRCADSSGLNGCLALEIMMNTTQLLPRPKTTRKPRPVATRPVSQVLLEIAYCLHATKVVARPSRSK